MASAEDCSFPILKPLHSRFIRASFEGLSGHWKRRWADLNAFTGLAWPFSRDPGKSPATCAFDTKVQMSGVLQQGARMMRGRALLLPQRRCPDLIGADLEQTVEPPETGERKHCLEIRQ